MVTFYKKYVVLLVFGLFLTSYLLITFLSWRNSENDGEFTKFHTSIPFTTRNGSLEQKKYASSKILFRPPSRENVINCSSLTQFCIEEQFIAYKHSYEIVVQDVIDFGHVLLVVTFNKPHFEAIRYLHLLYKDVFSDIIYCIPSIWKIPPHLAALVNISIIEYTEEPTDPTGSNFYRCLPKTLDKLPQKEIDNLDGILTISDDLIPNIWHFRKNRIQHDVLREKLWLLDQQLDVFDIDTLKFCRVFSSDNKLDCDIAGERDWKVQIDNQEKLQRLFEDGVKIYPDFFKRLATVAKGNRRVFNNYGDLFYVSAEYFDEAFKMFNFFDKYDIYMEFAIGTIIRGLTADADHRIDFIDRSGQLGPEEGYKYPSDEYDARRPIYHPFKLGRLYNEPFTEQCIYCSIFDMMNTFAKLVGRK